MKKLLLFVATVTLAIAGTKPKTFKVSLPDAEYAGSVALKAGDYKAAVWGNTLTFAQGKKVAAIVAVKVMSSPAKFTDTSVLVSNGRLEQVRVGGTTTRIVLQ
jgi:hypothetical protein